MGPRVEGTRTRRPCEWVSQTGSHWLGRSWRVGNQVAEVAKAVTRAVLHAGLFAAISASLAPIRETSDSPHVYIELALPFFMVGTPRLSYELARQSLPNHPSNLSPAPRLIDHVIAGCLVGALAQALFHQLAPPKLGDNDAWLASRKFVELDDQFRALKERYSLLLPDPEIAPDNAFYLDGDAWDPTACTFQNVEDGSPLYIAKQDLCKRRVKFWADHVLPNITGTNLGDKIQALYDKERDVMHSKECLAWIEKERILAGYAASKVTKIENSMRKHLQAISEYAFDGRVTTARVSALQELVRDHNSDHGVPLAKRWDSKRTRIDWERSVQRYREDWSDQQAYQGTSLVLRLHDQDYAACSQQRSVIAQSLRKVIRTHRPMFAEIAAAAPQTPKTNLERFLSPPFYEELTRATPEEFLELVKTHFPRIASWRHHSEFARDFNRIISQRDQILNQEIKPAAAQYQRWADYCWLLLCALVAARAARPASATQEAQVKQYALRLLSKGLIDPSEMPHQGGWNFHGIFCYAIKEAARERNRAFFGENQVTSDEEYGGLCDLIAALSDAEHRWLDSHIAGQNVDPTLQVDEKKLADLYQILSTLAMPMHQNEPLLRETTRISGRRHTELIKELIW